MVDSFFIPVVAGDMSDAKPGASRAGPPNGVYLSPQALCGVAGRVYWSVKGRVPCLVERVYLENGLLGVGCVCVGWCVGYALLGAWF